MRTFISVLAMILIGGVAPSALAGGSGQNGVLGTTGIPGQVVIKGPTAGVAICAEPVRHAYEKQAYCYLKGYRNATATPQAFILPTPFHEKPGAVLEADGAPDTTTSAIYLPTKMARAYSAWIIVEGF